MSLTEIKNALAELPESKRGSVAAWLLESLPPHSGEDATDEGVAEAGRRRDELDSRGVKPVSADEFWAAVARERGSLK